eukprot:63229-Ditylum_brightwellii.AAC.1
MLPRSEREVWGTSMDHCCLDGGGVIFFNLEGEGYANDYGGDDDQVKYLAHVKTLFALVEMVLCSVLGEKAG